MSFQKLNDVLRSLKSRYPAFSKRLIEAEALGRWEKAVGPSIAKHSKAVRVENSVLWVEVDHPIWKSELHHRKQQILTILNDQRQSVEKESMKPVILTDLLFLDPRPGRGIYE